MTRSQFIKKWLGNPERPFYTEQFRNEMLDDLDMVAQYQNEELKEASNVAADLKQENKKLKEALRELSDAVYNHVDSYPIHGELDTTMIQAEQLLKTKSE